MAGAMRVPSPAFFAPPNGTSTRPHANAGAGSAKIHPRAAAYAQSRLPLLMLHMD